MLAVHILGKQERGLLELGGERGMALDAGILGVGRWNQAQGEAQQKARHFQYPRSEKVAR
jgi:hypothetical protein